MAWFQTENLRMDVEKKDVGVLWLDTAGRPVNVFTPRMMADLDALFDRILQARPFQTLIIRSAKPSGFIAGADIHEFTKIQSPEEASELSARGQRLFTKLATLPVPTIAVVQGVCLGGGLEFALACDYRLAIDDPKTQMGLPEVELGLLPGWGGTQRLPRVVGLEPALKMILGARRLKAAEALRWGLADALASSDFDAVLAGLIAKAASNGKAQRTGLPLLNWRQRLLESTALGRALIFRGAERILRQRVPDDMPAPAEALEAVRRGIKQDMPAGLAYEREASGRLATSPACHNLVNLFFQREKSRKLPAEVRADLVVPIRRVGVVGAGTMGAGIAQLAAVKGFEVVVQEVNDAALAAGMSKIQALFDKAVEHRVLSAEEARHKIAAIRPTTTWQGFGNVDLVVEAAIEDLDAKRAIFRELEQRTKPTALLATNTSSLLVENLHEGRAHPERVGGLHFFNPVHKMPLIEVVRAPATDDAAVATLARWAIDLGKMPVIVKDSPGFVVNRILMPYLNEAVLVMGEGHSAPYVDRLMRKFGMPMGPLELLDQIGLDVAAHVEQSMRPAFAGRYTPNPCFTRMRERGWLGEKCGVGFYCHHGKSRKPNNAARGAFPKDEGKYPVAFRHPGTVSGTALADRLVLLMVNEAAACLGEGLTSSAEAIDAAMVFGTGWAPHRGGPLHYADHRGLREIVKRLDEFTQNDGPRFEPCTELRRRAEAGEGFYRGSEVPAHV
ncbi:MAG: enoyl-CoA hydratase/isomerase family protein [Gemmataceae bacterium]|nr:enoyl-CoA hydratase/isomerase family protein [Gemmataceae bacterium]